MPNSVKSWKKFVRLVKIFSTEKEQANKSDNISV